MMRHEDVFRIAVEHFPLCHVGEDSEGEVIIFTGLISDENQELREMTHEDIAYRRRVQAAEEFHQDRLGRYKETGRGWVDVLRQDDVASTAR